MIIFINFYDILFVLKVISTHKALNHRIYYSKIKHLQYLIIELAKHIPKTILSDLVIFLFI